MPVPGGLDDAPRAALGVLVSGEGTILEALAERSRDGGLGAPIALVVADRPGVPALARARRLGLPALERPRPPGPRGAWAGSIDAALRAAGVTLVVLDGFRSILPGSFLERWPARVLNVHPSLLPAFGGPGMYGPAVLRAILASGTSETGVTVHEVVEAVDAGPVRAQRRLRIAPGETVETLRERLRPLEIDALVEVIRATVST